MRALILDSYSQPLRLASIPRPTPGAGQVLVRIVASGTNPLDVKIMRGAAPHARHPPPSIRTVGGPFRKLAPPLPPASPEWSPVNYFTG